MSNVTVTIGRNVGDVAMSRHAWSTYRRAVRAVLAEVDAEIYADGARYRGQWGGIYEDAAIWLAAVDDAYVPAMRTALAGLAHAYDQDAIGLTVGTGELVA
jgi:hypothetical protein